MPNEIVLLLAGAYAIHSPVGLVAGIAFVSLADIGGSTSLYWATRTGGVWLVDRILGKMGHDPEISLNRWRRRVGDRDVLVIVIGRMLPVVRMTVAVGAGLLRIPADDFVVGVIPGGFFWAGLPLALGFIFRAHVHQLIHAYHRFSHITLLLLPPLIALAIVFWLAHKKIGAKASAESAKR